MRVEVIKLKKELNAEREEKRLLVVDVEKYKGRVEYLKGKFNLIKNKGDKIKVEAVLNNES